MKTIIKHLKNRDFDTDFHYQEVSLWTFLIEKTII